MMRTSLFLALLACAGAAFAPDASAQSVGFSIGKRSRHGSVELRVSNEGFRANYARTYPSPRFTPTSRTRCEPYRRPYPPRPVWVPAGCHREWVPARYETRYDPCGRRYQVLVSRGQWVTRCHHGRWTHGHERR